MKIGILTGGGDCPGLNSVIYGILLKSYKENFEVFGLEKGWKGLIEEKMKKLEVKDLDGLHKLGGTFIYTSRTNPFSKLKTITNSDEKEKERKKIIDSLKISFKNLGLDVLIAIGGDDTLGVASQLSKFGNLKVIGVPKTIDNDLSNTDYTFGFWSAVQLASDSMDNLVTTAKSHQRVFVVQVMGRDAGWLTIASGLSSGVSIILIPEIEFNFKKDIVTKLKDRVIQGFKYHIIACAEGATPTEASLKNDFQTVDRETLEKLPKDVFGNPLLNKLNMAQIIVKELEIRDDLASFFQEHNHEFEIRDVILGHTMRSGTPNSFDRILGLRLGAKTVNLVKEGKFGKMVCLNGEKIDSIELSEGAQKKVISEKNHKDWLELLELMTLVKNND